MAALFAGLTYRHDLLQCYLNTTPDTGSTPSISIPADNKAIITDIHQTVDDITPPFHMLSPDYDILQANQSIITALPVSVNIFSL